MTQPFRWKNCYADILSNRNGSAALAYIKDVVEPSLAKLDAAILAMSQRHDDPAAVFGIGPARELHRATLAGYCLALQALWEKQIRTYLQRCAFDLNAPASLAKEIPKASWQELDGIFRELRGIPLSAFGEHRSLTLLHLLGNVCRHGNGPSVERLGAADPELWPQASEPRHVPPVRVPGPPQPFVRSAENLQISLDLLHTLAAAIDSFWREAEYIYNESIEPKHPSLELALARRGASEWAGVGRGIRRWRVLDAVFADGGLSRRTRLPRGVTAHRRCSSRKTMRARHT
jgi:hypothetical protein